MKVGAKGENPVNELIEIVIYSLKTDFYDIKYLKFIEIICKINSKYPAIEIDNAIQKLYDILNKDIEFILEIITDDDIPIDECYLDYQYDNKNKYV